MEPDFEDDDDKIIAWLENEGALEWVGMDDNGERILSFNLDRLQVVSPEIYETFMEDMNENLKSLYENGLVEVEYDESLQPRFRISEEGKKLMREYGFEMEWENYEGPDN